MAMEQHDEEAMEWYMECENKLLRERDVCVQALNTSMCISIHIHIHIHIHIQMHIYIYIHIHIHK